MKEQLEKFDLGKAHCFDPNEEYKLRQIMYLIGETRIEEIKEAVLKLVDRQYSRSSLWAKFLDRFCVFDMKKMSTAAVLDEIDKLPV